MRWRLVPGMPYGEDEEEIPFRKTDPGLALRTAAKSGRHWAVEALLNDGTDVDASDTHPRWTALMFAARYNHSGIVKALLKAGANPIFRDVDNWTPLHIAAMNGSDNCIQPLIEAMGPSWLRDSYDFLEAALQEGHFRCAELLYHAGADMVSLRKFPSWILAKRELCKRAALTLYSVLRFGFVLEDMRRIPHEVAGIIARKVWETRLDVEWEVMVPKNKKSKFCNHRCKNKAACRHRCCK